MRRLIAALVLLCSLSVGEDFTVIAIPDMQQKPALYPDKWDTMVQWIVDHRVSENIKAVIGVGDTVDDANSAQQWTYAMQGFDGLHGFNALDAAGLVYDAVPGNHDTFTDWRPATQYNLRFGTAHFAGKSWYGDTNFEPGNGANFWLTFEAGNLKFLIIGMEFYPRPEVLTWALGVIDAHPDRQVIFVTHGYLRDDATPSRVADGDPYGPVYYSLDPAQTSNGQEMWDGLFKLRRNALLTLNGHFTSSVPTHRSDAGAQGNTVHQIFTGHGGDDTFLMALKFQPDLGRITVRYFDAATDTDRPGSPFTLAYAPLAGTAGIGCTTAHHIDKDCDGYGLGGDPNDPNPLLGRDADDNDSSVHTAAQGIAKYGTFAAFLAHLGYNPLHYWYVDVVAGNDSTCARDGGACATYGKVHTAGVAAGDMVVFRAGTYTDAQLTYYGIPGMYPTPSGTQANPIVFLAYPGESVVLNYGGAIGNGNSSANWVTFDGFEVTSPGGTGEISAANMTGVTYRNLVIHHTGRGIHTGVWQDRLLIEDNLIYDTTQEHCIYLGGVATASTNITVRRNLLHHCTYHAFQYNGPVTGMLVEGNIGHSSQLGCFSLLEGVSNSTFRNNVCFNNARSAVIIYDYDDTCYSGGPICPGDQKNNVFENNTFWVGRYDPKTGGDISNQPGVLFNDGSSTGPHDFSGNIFRNNAMVTQIAPAFSYYQNLWFDTTVMQNNVLNRSDGGTTEVSVTTTNYSIAGAETLYPANISANIGADPLYAASNIGWWNAPGNFNLALQAASPAIDAGTATGAPAMDIRAVLRTGNPDAGAYEYTPGGVAPAIASTSPLPTGIVGAAYSQTLTATGDTPITWSVISGSEPDGTALAGNGVLSGTPTKAAIYNFVAQASNAAGSDSREMSVTINPTPTTLTVAFAAPAAGASLSGVVTIEVTATDNVGIASVSVSANGVSLGSGSAAPCTLTWDTAKTGNGAYVLTAVALDASGNQATSSINVAVNNLADTTPPAVSIVSPTSGAVISGSVTVSVSVSDNLSVIRTELYVDGVLAASSKRAPFDMKWNTRKASGYHQLLAKAFDAAGNIGASAPVAVQVAK